MTTKGASARRGVHGPCRRIGRTAVLLTAAAAASQPAIEAQEVPGEDWASPLPSAQWRPEALDSVAAFAESLGSAAVMVVHEGRLVLDVGATDVKYRVASVRKSLLSGLFGIAVRDSLVSLESNLLDLGIDDREPSLTDEERRATLLDLITARSGVYHDAAFEPRSMREGRPERGSFAPGEHWFYNNWDFNALGTAFEKAAGTSVFEAFGDWIAGPVGMQDYVPEDGEYVRDPATDHPAYVFRITARDLARFGLLMLRGGEWGGESIIPTDWVMASTSESVDLRYGGYGYMWWTGRGWGFEETSLPPDTFMASGTGSHYLIVIPSRDLVIVHLGETNRPRPTNG